ncbi:hypothetical protein LA303_02150 [Candidatus Sulfidibacterium hydrothermale]|uniref:P-loop NTPase fold protein n=1 Tax=Candidatus Sulfidibacterium hydrothermale TaxID=2875962 RepID=UPI001F0A198C|nr:P-loop NTPase fold protein [Candidatus Sulfidibacterium hydrothermale]UBM62793.1 hypothetical protein LA303_02150 [Candidatus Sulfidibacterium hydrothermale]
MEQEKYFIDISKQKDKFKSHLGLEQNDRTIFSAKFGDGKTTFLRKFFENNVEYNAIHIYPVNYSVASNEDIFELIKYDVLFELIANKIDFDDSVDSFVTIAKDFFQESKGDILKLLTPFLSVIPLIGGALKESTERALDFTKKALDHFDNSQKTELDIVEEYLKEFTITKGSIYEEDFYARLITSLVERFRLVDTENNNPKKTVLVIDDLDRIDPEHIFRILNVFAAHQDINTRGNKFGFDKIIVVCDIDNVRNIFHHKYGTNTDFNGYIDKFYSVDVFKYSMLDELYEEVSKILNSIEGNSVFIEAFELRRNPNQLFKLIQYLLLSFVKFGVINVRDIVKLKEKKFILNEYVINSYNTYFNTRFAGILIFNVLKIIFGDYQNVLTAFDKSKVIIAKNNNFFFDKEWLLENVLLPIHCIDKNVVIELPMISGESIEISARLDKKSQLLTYGYWISEIESSLPNRKEVIQNYNLHELFYMTYKLAFEKNYLK